MSKSARRCSWLLLLPLFLCPEVQARCLHFEHGRWFNNSAFVRADFYSFDGTLTRVPCAQPEQVDLHGGYVVPPYGDAHEHNFDSLSRAPAQARAYLADGVFYAQGMTDVTSGAVAVVNSGYVNTPASVDVTYAHGGLTGYNGHPKEVYESIPLGFYYPSTPEQKALVIQADKRRGQAYWEMESPEDLDLLWPRILASHPDLIKIYLTESESWKPWSAADPRLGLGLNPALVPLITARAHAAGLKVAAHVDTVTDAAIAIDGNVDELGHLPGYFMAAENDPARFRLPDALVLSAKRHHIRVQATAGIYVDEHTDTADLAARRALQIDNLGRLKHSGVPVLIGSDHYGQDPVHEMDYLQSLGVWSNLEMLRMACVTTPQAIFPNRKIGQLRPAYEASFLVLIGNPMKEWKQVHSIVGRWKQGEPVPVGASTE
jgi:hypothetical protein